MKEIKDIHKHCKNCENNCKFNNGLNHLCIYFQPNKKMIKKLHKIINYGTQELTDELKNKIYKSIKSEYNIKHFKFLIDKENNMYMFNRKIPLFSLGKIDFKTFEKIYKWYKSVVKD